MERIRQGPWQPILDENGKIVGRTRRQLDVQWLDDEPARLQEIYRRNNINAGVVGDSYQFWRDARLIEALEERFHMVPQRLITRREMAAGRPGLGNEFPRYEIQVKEFMIRHQRLLGLSNEDVAALQRMIDAPP